MASQFNVKLSHFLYFKVMGQIFLSSSFFGPTLPFLKSIL